MSFNSVTFGPRRPSASEVLGPSFPSRSVDTADSNKLRVSAPECSPASDLLGELSLTVELPPLRIAPPGHESCVSFSSVKDDPSPVLISCEEETEQERLANLKKTADESEKDDVTLVDPAETAQELINRDVNLQSLINRCLRASVKHTRSAARDARLLGLRSLRGQQRLMAAASSNMESDEEDEDLDDTDED